MMFRSESFPAIGDGRNSIVGNGNGRDVIVGNGRDVIVGTGSGSEGIASRETHSISNVSSKIDKVHKQMRLQIVMSCPRFQCRAI